MSERDETKWPWAPYDAEAPLAERVAYLEARCLDYAREEWFYESWLNKQAEAVHEIASSLVVEPAARSGKPATMATYWRWKLWEDCMVDVSDQVDRCLQALIAGAVWP